MRILGSVLAVLLLVSAGCKDDKPKADETKKSEPTPVPSGLVFNDFVPQTGGPTGMRARDAGLEGGLADVQGNGVDDPGGPAAGGVTGNGTKVTDAGSDPKAVRKYTFTAGKVDKRVVTINTSVQQSMGGQTGPAQEIAMKVALDLTPKAVKKEGATMEMKLTKIDIPGIPAQAAPMLAQLTGLSGTFDVTASGDVGEMQMAASPAMRNELAQTVVQALSQSLQLIVCPLPSEPIGAGAKWDVSGQPGQPEAGTKHFFAKELGADGAQIETDIEILVPRRVQQTPRGNVFVEAQGKGKYAYQVKWNSTAPHVEGSMTINEKIETSGTPQQPKQQMAQIQTMKHVVDVAK